MTGPSSRPMRRDAAANHQRLLEAATTVVRRDGTTVPVAVIAEAAGVGVGTLYRHFPTRADLLTALVEQSLRQVLAHAEQATEESTGRDAVVAFLHAAIEGHDQLILPLHGGPDLLALEIVRLQEEIQTVIGSMLARGVQDGSLREGLLPIDVVHIGALLARGLAHVRDWPQSARRQVEIYVSGLAPRTD